MLNYPTNQHQKIHNCTRLPQSRDFRYDIGRKYISEIQSPIPHSITTHAIISGTYLPPVHQLPAHAIICDFLLHVTLFLSAIYKMLIFLISKCWQAIMVRTKTHLSSGYTRVRTVSGSTVTTTFVPRDTRSHDSPGTIPPAGTANTTEPAHHPGI